MPNFEGMHACKDADPNLFLEGTNHVLTPENKMAKAICASCVVKDACLAWALTTELDGILAGTTSRERKQLKAHRLRHAS